MTARDAKGAEVQVEATIDVTERSVNGVENGHDRINGTTFLADTEEWKKDSLRAKPEINGEFLEVWMLLETWGC